VKAVWEPLIEPGMCAELQDVQAERTATFHERRAGWRFYWLRGLVRCTCGRRLYGHMSKSPVYYCPREMGGCGESRVSALKLEEMIGMWIVKRLGNVASAGVTTRVAVPPAVQQGMAQDEKRLEELQDMFTNHDLTRAQFIKMKRVVEARLRENKKIAVVKPMTALVGMTGARAPGAWRDALPPRRKVVASLLIDDLVVAPSTRQGVFDPDRVTITPAKF